MTHCLPAFIFNILLLCLGYGDLVIAALVETPEVEPDFREVRVDADRARVCVKCVAVLVDLKV
jgi:hypothetical protein